MKIALFLSTCVNLALLHKLWRMNQAKRKTLAFFKDIHSRK